MPMTYNQIRAKYPKYAGFTDQQLADHIYNTQYSHNMPRAQFDQLMAVRQAAPTADLSSQARASRRQANPAAAAAPALAPPRPQPRAAPAPQGGSPWTMPAGAMATFNAAIPGGDEFADAAGALADTAFHGKSLGQAWHDARARSAGLRQQFQAAHPWGAAVANTAAAIPAMAAGAMTGGASELPALSEAASAGGGLLKGLGRAAMTGLKSATTGALAGFGQGAASEGDWRERLAAGNAGIAPGAAAGVAIPAALAAGRKVMNLGSSIFAPAETKAAVKAANILRNRAPQAFDPAMQPAPGSQQMPFEAWNGGPGKSGAPVRLARAVANTPGPGQDAAAAKFAARRQAMPARLNAAAGGALDATGADYHPTMQMTQAAQQEAYGPARQAADAVSIDPIDFQNHLGPLIDTRIGRQAMDSASRLAEADEATTGVRNYFPHNIIQDGRVQKVQIPNASTLGYMTRGWDEQLAPYRNPYTGVLNVKGSPQAQAILRMRQEFVRRMGDLLPEDAAARAAWADPQGQIDAMQRGRAIIGSNVDPEDVQMTNDTQTPEQLQAQRTGLARGVSDKLLGPNPRAFVRQLGGDWPNLASRVQAGFADPAAFDQFHGAVQDEGNYEQSYKDVMGGSRTTPLAADIADANQAAEEQGGSGIIDKAMDIAANRITGTSFKRQAIGAVGDALRGAGKIKALNDPRVHQILGDVLFNGTDPAVALQNAAKQNIIDPSDVVNLMPYVSAAAGSVGGADTAMDRQTPAPPQAPDDTGQAPIELTINRSTNPDYLAWRQSQGLGPPQ